MEITWVVLISVRSFKGLKKGQCVTVLQTEVVTSLKALSRLVDGSQLSSHFDGSLRPSRCDWMQLHQVGPSSRGATASLACSSLLNISSCAHFLFRDSSHLCLTCTRPWGSSIEPSAS